MRFAKEGDSVAAVTTVSDSKKNKHLKSLQIGSHPRAFLLTYTP